VGARRGGMTTVIRGDLREIKGEERGE
jgi:hypothetical protein